MEDSSCSSSSSSSSAADFVDYLGPDTSATVFTMLDHPAHLARASAVSRSWRQFGLQKVDKSAEDPRKGAGMLRNNAAQMMNICGAVLEGKE